MGTGGRVTRVCRRRLPASAVLGFGFWQKLQRSRSASFA
jgi:hypothetical protein